MVSLPLFRNRRQHDHWRRADRRRKACFPGSSQRPCCCFHARPCPILNLWTYEDLWRHRCCSGFHRYCQKREKGRHKGSGYPGHTYCLFSRRNRATGVYLPVCSSHAVGHLLCHGRTVPDDRISVKCPCLCYQRHYRLPCTEPSGRNRTDTLAYVCSCRSD